jgi:uncharacterized membrane protein HdeD (DUF308 family)
MGGFSSARPGSTVPSAVPTRAFEARHLQLVRALFAALAAVMVTFSPDHSATVGLAVFSGFAIATGLAFVLSAWLVFAAGERWPALTLGLLSLVAGMFAGIGPWRTTIVFFVIVIAWSFATGLVETIAAARARRTAPQTARDGLVIGILTLVLGVALLFVSPQYALEYSIEEAGTFTLTGITIAVGVYGGYAAIVAVYLGIAALSPRRESTSAPEREEADA